MKRTLLILLAVAALTFGAKQTFAQCSVAPITGSTTLCPPSFTTTLSDATPGGTWSTRDGGPVSIDASTGVVTGISGGVAIITYTVGGCPVYYNMTNPMIIGLATLCYSAPASTITLSDAVGGGSWSSSSTVASVSLSGDVTAGLGFVGTLAYSTISYTLPGAVCGGASVTQSVAVDPIPAVTTFTVAPTVTDPICESYLIGFTTTITGSGGLYTYSWWGPTGTFGTNTSSGTSSNIYQLGGATLSERGTYTTQVADGLGCLSVPATFYATVAHLPVTVNVTPTSINGGDPIYLSGSEIGVDYYMYDPSATVVLGSTPGTGSSLTITASSSGMYSGIGIVARNAAALNCAVPLAALLCSGCRGTSGATGINTLKGVSVLSLVPNPNNGEFTITGGANFMQSAPTVKMEITDVTGQVVLSKDVPVTNGRVSQTIELPGDLASGVYFVKISTEAGSQVLRLSMNR